MTVTNWMLDLGRLTPETAQALTWRRAGYDWAERQGRGAGWGRLNGAPNNRREQAAFAAGVADCKAGRSRYEVEKAAAPDAVWAMEDDNADAY